MNIQRIIEGDKKKKEITISLRLSDKLQYLDYFKNMKNDQINNIELNNYLMKKSSEYQLCWGYMRLANFVGLFMVLLLMATLLYILIKENQ